MGSQRNRINEAVRLCTLNISYLVIILIESWMVLNSKYLRYQKEDGFSMERIEWKTAHVGFMDLETAQCNDTIRKVIQPLFQC